MSAGFQFGQEIEVDRRLAQLPQFDCYYIYDNPCDVAEVTIVPDEYIGGDTTTWVSAKVEDTVPLTEVR